MKDSFQPAKRRRYDAALRAEALRLASESRSTQAAARALNIDPKRIYKWQKKALTPVAAARGAELNPAAVAELRQLRAANRRQAQELPHKPILLLAADYRQFMTGRTVLAALMGGLFHALQFRDKPEAALAEAAQAGGRTADALTGALRGAHLGEAAWSTGWSRRHDLAKLTLTVADNLFTHVKGDYH